MLISLTGQTIGGPNDPKSDYGDTCKFDSPITNYLWIMGLSGMGDDELNFGDMSFVMRLGRRILWCDSVGNVESVRMEKESKAILIMRACEDSSSADIDPCTWIHGWTGYRCSPVLGVSHGMDYLYQ